MSDEEILNQCQWWISRGSDADAPTILQQNDINFDQCQQIVRELGRGRNVATGTGSRFFTWWTFASLLLAVLIPYAFVAFYTGFKFQWKGQEEGDSSSK